MTPAGRNGPPPSRAPSRVEWLGLLGVLIALALFLGQAYDLVLASDPGRWYRFGTHFREGFASAGLAYGFPLLLAGAAALVGPLPAALVNLPLLLILTALVADLARHHVPLGHPRRAQRMALAGAALLCLWLLLDRGTLVYQVSPYRDPLAHVLVIAACLLLVRARESSQPSSLPVAGSAACLALACSTRETSALMLLPLLVVALAARREDPTRPFWRPLTVFVATFGLVCLPLLLQNALTTGNPLLPGQAAGEFREVGALVPGWRVSWFRDGLPRLLAYLASHYGPLGLLAIALGVAVGVRERDPLLFTLSLPALLTYAFFYAAYDRPVGRYLFVLDLFALPVAAAGLAWAADALLVRVPRRAGPGAAAAATVALFALAAALALRGGWSGEARFHISDARRLAEDVARVLPADAALLGTAPVVKLLGSLLPHEAHTLRGLVPSRNVNDPDLSQRLREFQRASDPLYFASRSGSHRHLLMREFDLENALTFDGSEYGLGAGPAFVDRVVPWSRRATATGVSARRSGRQILALDVGHLSKFARSRARVLWGSQRLDTQPRDGINYYLVDAPEERPQRRVRLVSDGPVPEIIHARLLALDAPLTLEFDRRSVIVQAGRLSPSFLSDPKPDFATLHGAGWVDVPTVAPEGARFVVVAEVRVNSREAGYQLDLELGPRQRPIGVVRLPSEAFVRGTPPERRVVSFALPPERVRSANTRVDWHIEVPPEQRASTSLSLERLRIHRIELGAPVRIELGLPSDEAFVASGFHAGEASPEAPVLYWRWTRGPAALRLFAAGGRAARLVVRTLSGARPAAAGVAPPEPRFALNGRALRATAPRVEDVGALRRSVWTFPLPAARLARGLNLLEIDSATWVPRDATAAADARTLGVMVESVHLEPQP